MSSMINNHKRMAMGMKSGGAVHVNATPTGAGKMVPRPGSGMGGSPITTAKRNNGMPGMKTGGAVAKTMSVPSMSKPGGMQGKAASGAGNMMTSDESSQLIKSSTAASKMKSGGSVKRSPCW